MRCSIAVKTWMVFYTQWNQRLRSAAAIVTTVALVMKP